MTRRVLTLLGWLTLAWVGPASAAGFLTLTWQEASTDVIGFLVERAPATGAPPVCATFAQIASLGVVLTYQDHDAVLAPGGTFCYRVRAVNAVGNSLYSNVASGAVVIVGPIAGITLTVAGTGSGVGGTVQSSPAGLRCAVGATCTAVWPNFTLVKLTATPKRNRSRFVGWTGACTGTASTCSLVLTGPVVVGASFAR